MRGQDYKSESLLSLSGVYQPKKEMKDSKILIALTTFLSANPQIKTIVLHLDNDKVGRLCKFLFFIIGTMLGGLFSVVCMCCLQINRLSERKEEDNAKKKCADTFPLD